MLRIAEVLPPQLSATTLWPLMQQAGIRHAVGTFYGPSGLLPGETPWSYGALLRLREQYRAAGFALDVLEARPPLNLAKRGLPGGEQEVDAVVELLENMGRLGISTWCYEWMADFNWLRTATAVPARGGSTVSAYDHALMQAGPDSALGPLPEERLWDTLGAFLQRVVPVAERAGVRLAMHPDDPPLSPIRGVGRIMRSLEAFDRLLDLAPSPVNGITLCQGNFGLMTDDLPAAIRHFAGRERVFFVHMRDVRGTPERFAETWHDDGPTDLLACMEAYRDAGFDGVLRPDHVPAVAGEPNDQPGYGVLGRLFAVGYLRGLQEAAYRTDIAAAGGSLDR